MQPDYIAPSRRGTCSECGKAVRISTSSAPPERRRCRDCQRARPKNPIEPRVCDECQRTYVPKRAHRPDQRWCSKSCAQKVRNRMRASAAPSKRPPDWEQARQLAKSRARRLRHAQTWDGITDEEILERDGWRCQIPGCRRRPIRKDLKYPDLRSKSVDHIVPLSLGGDDTSENKRAAHLGCNMARGNEMGDEQVALFGSIREAPLASLTVGERMAKIQRRPRGSRRCPCGGKPLPGKRKFCQDCYDRRAAEAEELQRVRQAAAQTLQLKAEQRAALYAEIRKLRAEGFTTYAIAAHLGTSQRMVVRVGLADPVTGKVPS